MGASGRSDKDFKEILFMTKHRGAIILFSFLYFPFESGQCYLIKIILKKTKNYLYNDFPPKRALRLLLEKNLLFL